MWIKSLFFDNLFIWVLVLAFALPFVVLRIAQWQSQQRFVQARHIELSNPIDAQARYQLACLFLKQRRFNKALPLLEEAYKIQQERPPFTPRLLDDLARVYLRKERTQDALPLLKQSIELEPHGNQGETFLLLGHAFLQDKQTDKARQCFQQTHEINTSLAEPIFRIACIEHAAGDTTQAKQRVRDFLKDAGHLPAFIRRRNRPWVLAMRLFPLSASFFS